MATQLTPAQCSRGPSKKVGHPKVTVLRGWQMVPPCSPDSLTPVSCSGLSVPQCQAHSLCASPPHQGFSEPRPQPLPPSIFLCDPKMELFVLSPKCRPLRAAPTATPVSFCPAPFGFGHRHWRQKTDTLYRKCDHWNRRDCAM